MEILFAVALTLVVTVVEGGQEVKKDLTMGDKNNIFQNSTTTIFQHKPILPLNCGVDSDHLTKINSATDTSIGQPDHDIIKEGRRHRRSAKQMQLESHRLYIDFRITVDSSMTSFHGHGDNLKKYIRTVLGITAQLFRHPSLGQSIDIALMEVTEQNINLVPQLPDGGGFNRDELLKAFCKFIAGRGHGTSIFLTRKPLCGSSSKDCDTMGFAKVGTICDPESSCAIIRDHGIRTGFVLAHEVGHLLGMHHDNNDDKCAKFVNVKLKNGRHHDHSNIMNSHAGGGAHPRHWTKCSRHYIDLLLADKKDCLEQRPQGQLILGDDSDDASTTFDLSNHVIEPDRQCHLMFAGGDRDGQGPHRRCDGKFNCSQIECAVGRSCLSINEAPPWLDGTRCGPDRWCIRGECDDKKVFKVIDGGWGPWTKDGPCSRSCGGGFWSDSRQCNNPVPQNGGRFCVGERLRFKSCNMVPCIGRKKPSRADQCSSLSASANEIWVPDRPNLKSLSMDPATKRRSKSRLQCELKCVDRRSSRSVTLDIMDGTRCADDDLDDFSVCVNGLCHPAGCDGILNSEAKFDSCDVCGGRDACLDKIVRGSYNEKGKNEYRHVVTIPKGATLIKIRQSSETGLQYRGHGAYDNNYLVLAVPAPKDDPRNVTIVLNQFSPLISFQHGFKRIRVAETNLDYSGCDVSVETLSSPRGSPPTTTELIVQVYSHPSERLSSPNIYYEYYVHSGSSILLGLRSLVLLMFIVIILLQS